MTNKINFKDLSNVTGGINIPKDIFNALKELEYPLIYLCSPLITEDIRYTYDKAVSQLNSALNLIYTEDEASFKEILKELVKTVDFLSFISDKLHSLLYNYVNTLKNVSNGYI